MSFACMQVNYRSTQVSASLPQLVQVPVPLIFRGLLPGVLFSCAASSSTHWQVTIKIGFTIDE